MDFSEKRPLYRLKELAAILRGENGCAWDRAQTSRTLKPYLVEETYEVYEAVEKGNREQLKEELGDLLYQIYAHSQIAEEEGAFTIDDVAEGIVNKLVGRHPHVFGDEVITDQRGVSERWEKIKKKEKPHRESILDGIPIHLPSLLKAYRIQQRVSRVGFDWTRADDIIDKLDEEILEFKEVLAGDSNERIMEEIGDILFTVANVSRFKGYNPEEALQKTIEKFSHRFRYVERKVKESGKNIEDVPLEELDRLWEEAKTRGK